MYKQYKVDGVIKDNAIQRVSDGAYIFFDPANTDFLEYQKWLSEGNTPEAAEASE